MPSEYELLTQPRPSDIQEDDLTGTHVEVGPVDEVEAPSTSVMESWPSPEDASFGKADGIEVGSTVSRSAAPEGSALEPPERAGEGSFSPPVSIEVERGRKCLHTRFCEKIAQPPCVTELRYGFYLMESGRNGSVSNDLESNLVLSF